MAELYRRFGAGLATIFAALVLLWLVGMVLAPNVMMIDYALRPNLPPARIGGPDDVYSLDNILYLANEGVHRAIFFKTVWASAFVAFVTFVVCYPLAFWLAQHATPAQTGIAILALTIPFWINEVLRTLAWYILLAFRGPLSALLLSVGIIDEPMRWYGNGGVLAGMVYAYILFMLFPIYNSIESLEKAQIEAARDLGASTGASTGAWSSRTPRPASPPAASSPSCWRPAPMSRPLCSARRAAAGSPRSSTTGSSRAATGTGARPMRWCSWCCAWPWCWRR